MKTKFHLLCILGFVSFLGFSQDPVFLNSNQSLIHLNPSFAGSNGGLRYQFQYTRQRPGMTWLSTTYNSVDAYIKPLKAGIAISYLRDNTNRGLNRLESFGFTYAQHLKAGRLKIVPSVQVEYLNKNLDIKTLTFSDLLDYRLKLMYLGRAVSSQKANINFSTGLLAKYNSLYAGVLFSNINKPDIGMEEPYQLPVRFTAHVSWNGTLSPWTTGGMRLCYMHQGTTDYYQFQINIITVNHWMFDIGAGIINDKGPYPANAPRSYPVEYNSMYYSGNHFIVNLGYRASYFSISLAYNNSITRFAAYDANLSLGLSFNLRNKERRKLQGSPEDF